MSKSETDDGRHKGRRSTRRQKAIENGRFMLFFGIVIGSVFGLLVGIKFNIGKRSPQQTNRPEVTTNTGKNRAPVESTDSLETANPVSVDQKKIQFANFVSPATMSAPNPLLGFWTAWPSDQAIKLGFFEEGVCNIYNPVAVDFKYNVEGMLLTTVDYKFVNQPDPATWVPTTKNGSRFEWPEFEISSTFDYEDRDGSEATDTKIHKIVCAAELKGADTPEDTDDYIVYEINFYNEFFRLEEGLPRHTKSMSRRWNRTVETNLRDNPNPFAASAN